MTDVVGPGWCWRSASLPLSPLAQGEERPWGGTCVLPRPQAPGGWGTAPAGALRGKLVPQAAPLLRAGVRVGGVVRASILGLLPLKHSGPRRRPARRAVRGTGVTVCERRPAWEDEEVCGWQGRQSLVSLLGCCSSQAGAHLAVTSLERLRRLREPAGTSGYSRNCPAGVRDETNESPRGPVCPASEWGSGSGAWPS